MGYNRIIYLSTGWPDFFHQQSQLPIAPLPFAPATVVDISIYLDHLLVDVFGKKPGGFFFANLNNQGCTKNPYQVSTENNTFELYIYILLGMYQVESDTPWKFKIDPQILPSKRECSLPTIIFRGYVKLWGCNQGAPKNQVETHSANGSMK